MSPPVLDSPAFIFDLLIAMITRIVIMKISAGPQLGASTCTDHVFPTWSVRLSYTSSRSHSSYHD